MIVENTSDNETHQSNKKHNEITSVIFFENISDKLYDLCDPCLKYNQNDIIHILPDDITKGYKVFSYIPPLYFSFKDGKKIEHQLRIRYNHKYILVKDDFDKIMSGTTLEGILRCDNEITNKNILKLLELRRLTITRKFVGGKIVNYKTSLAEHIKDLDKNKQIILNKIENTKNKDEFKPDREKEAQELKIENTKNKDDLKQYYKEFSIHFFEKFCEMYDEIYTSFSHCLELPDDLYGLMKHFTDDELSKKMIVRTIGDIEREYEMSNLAMGIASYNCEWRKNRYIWFFNQSLIQKEIKYLKELSGKLSSSIDQDKEILQQMTQDLYVLISQRKENLQQHEHRKKQFFFDNIFKQKNYKNKFNFQTYISDGKNKCRIHFDKAVYNGPIKPITEIQKDPLKYINYLTPKYDLNKQYLEPSKSND